MLERAFLAANIHSRVVVTTHSMGHLERCHGSCRSPPRLGTEFGPTASKGSSKKSFQKASVGAVALEKCAR